jgi:hypothetical protein
MSTALAILLVLVLCSYFVGVPLYLGGSLGLVLLVLLILALTGRLGGPG